MNTEMNSRMLERAVLTLLLGTSFTLVTGCGQRHQTAVSANVLAEVNGQPITEQAYRYWWTEHQPGPDTARNREALLDRLIARSAQVQAARQAGLDHDPILMEQVEDLLIRRLEETRLFPQVRAVEVSASEVEAYYQSNLLKKFTLPEHSRLAVLWFNTRGEAPLAARYRLRLENARAAVLSDPQRYPVQAGFGTLAIQNSEHQASRYQGGDLGWLGASDTPGFRTTVEKIGRQLKEPGDLSPVTESGDGLFVVRLIERKPAHVRELAAVYEDIHRKLLHENQQEVEQRFQSEITANAAVTRYAEHLSAVSNLPMGETSSFATVPPERFDSALANASQPRE